MSNQWLRLWHDMPTDPKWRTISRISKQSISEVISVYLHVLVYASNAIERGRTQGLCVEDIASALNLEDEQVTAIIDAMQGRVLEGDNVKGWDKRQPIREDGGAERAREWRKARSERKRTQANAQERPDTDTDTEVNRKRLSDIVPVLPLLREEPTEPKKCNDTETRIGPLCQTLRKLGFDCAPHLDAWKTLLPSYSDAEIIGAAQEARDSKLGERLHLNYLIPKLKNRSTPKHGPPNRIPQAENFDEKDYGTGGAL